MKKGIFLLIVALLGSIFISSAGASTLTVGIDGLDLLPLDTTTGETDVVWSYQLNFSIDGDWSTLETDSVDFNLTSNHGVSSGSSFITTWGTYANITDDGELVIMSDVTDPIQSPLLDGELFTVTYSDDVTLSLNYDSFLLYSDFTTAVDLALNSSTAVFGSGDNTLILSADSSSGNNNAVPIPSAILLLGGGLFGMLGIRRKIK